MAHKRYNLGDLRVVAFHTCNAATKAAFETFVRGLTLELDNEPGDDAEKGTWAWVKENDAVACAPFDTFIFLDRVTDKIVATASFVANDRGVATKLGLDNSPEYLGIWGFFLARRDLRRRRLGSVISKYMDDHVRAYVNSTGKARDIYLFTGVAHAIKIYERLGFAEVEGSVVSLEEFGFDEQLFKKRYEPVS